MSALPITPAERREILEALGSYQKRGRISYEIHEMADQLINESDRGVVVILGSLIEDILLERLLQSFVDLEPAKKKNLTRAGGLLSSFDHRVSLAQALGIIDQEMVAMLQVVKAMRNACAHSRLDIGFLTPQLRDALSLLFTEENAGVIRTSNIGPALRLMFIVAFVYISSVLKGGSTEAAGGESQRLLDRALEEARKAIARQTALREKRSKRPARRPPKGHND